MRVLLYAWKLTFQAFVVLVLVAGLSSCLILGVARAKNIDYVEAIAYQCVSVGMGINPETGEMPTRLMNLRLHADRRKLANECLAQFLPEAGYVFPVTIDTLRCRDGDDECLAKDYLQDYSSWRALHQTYKLPCSMFKEQPTEGCEVGR